MAVEKSRLGGYGWKWTETASGIAEYVLASQLALSELGRSRGWARSTHHRLRQASQQTQGCVGRGEAFGSTPMIVAGRYGGHQYGPLHRVPASHATTFKPCAV
jgi:hypothetical protein